MPLASKSVVISQSDSFVITSCSFVHISMHGGCGEVLGLHLFSDPINLPLGVDEYDYLRDGQSFIQVTQYVHLPLLLFHIHIGLVDTLQGPESK